MAKSLSEFMGVNSGTKPKKGIQIKTPTHRIETKKRKTSEPSLESPSSDPSSLPQSVSYQETEIRGNKLFKDELHNFSKADDCWFLSSIERRKDEDTFMKTSFKENEFSLNKFRLIKSSSENLKKYMEKHTKNSKLRKINETNSEVLDIIEQLNKQRKKLLLKLSKINKLII